MICKRYEGRVALVTGGASGIGKATVDGLAKAAVGHLTRHAAVLYAKDSIRVNVVAPGLTANPAVLNA